MWAYVYSVYGDLAAWAPHAKEAADEAAEEPAEEAPEEPAAEEPAEEAAEEPAELTADPMQKLQTLVQSVHGVDWEDVIDRVSLQF